MRSSTDDNSPSSLHQCHAIAWSLGRTAVTMHVADRAVVVDDPASATGPHVELDATNRAIARVRPDR